MEKKGSKCSPKHIYQILRTDRGGILHRVLKAFEINISIDSQQNDSKSDGLDFSLTEQKLVSPFTEIKAFKLVISRQIWDILLTKKKSKNRKYSILKRG